MCSVEFSSMPCRRYKRYISINFQHEFSSRVNRVRRDVGVAWEVDINNNDKIDEVKVTLERAGKIMKQVVTFTLTSVMT